MGEGALVRTLIDSDRPPNMILWGPPGCGKTSLAHVVACSTSHCFVQLSAVTATIQDVRRIFAEAQQRAAGGGRRTVLFVDEIHRFNKAQQDAFLPHIEAGTVALLGATTENPSFSCVSALLSRCRVVVLEKLGPDDLRAILLRAAHSPTFRALHPHAALRVAPEALDALCNLADGDARVAVDCLHLAGQLASASARSSSASSNAFNTHMEPSAAPTLTASNPDCAQSSGRKDTAEHGTGDSRPATIDVEMVKSALQKSHVLYDAKGDQHYDLISALHKSVRGSDADAALYWLGRMLEGGEDPLYISRRLIRMASEDVGLADPAALVQSVAAHQAAHHLGMPECSLALAQATVYLARAPKSVAVYRAYKSVQACIRSRDTPPVPLHLRNAPTKLMQNLGYAAGYQYNPDFEDGAPDQTYLPESLRGFTFFVPPTASCGVPLADDSSGGIHTGTN